MKKQFYVTPAIENITVEFEHGIAASGAIAPSGYGAEGAAGLGGVESGSTEW